jgi:4-amino-4-deoxy-L-arabinose transferase-like glycosyltransferase
MTNDSLPDSSFRGFLFSRCKIILLILLVACAFRFVLVLRFPLFGDDEVRYTAPAVNMLAGRGFSAATSGRFRPTMHTVPLYPLFIAGVYGVFGEHKVAVRIAQSLLDLITCVLVGFIAFSLAPLKLKELAALCGLAIYGFLSWFTVHWTRYLFTETLALFTTVLTISLVIVAWRRGSRYWLLAGITAGLALLARADAVLLVAAIFPLLIVGIVRRHPQALAGCALFCLGVGATLCPWIIRNYVAFHVFEPLANEYGFTHNEYMPKGYLWWLRTWMTDETYHEAFRPAFWPGYREFDPNILPDSVFDSPAEKQELFQLFEERNRTGAFTPEMSDRFMQIAKARIARAPLRFFIYLPLRRVVSDWLTSLATRSHTYRAIRIACVLPILIGGVAGFILSSSNRLVSGLLLLVILVRTLFLAYHYGNEARYIVEAYPAMIAACAVALAYLWNRFGSRARNQGVAS